ncbi:hypothetical protein SEA_SKOG_52 [Gordonia phage Skog]|uniref:Uncharacterized protein n=1 Tax=Gordonia phage Skog TaxID=2704033 RepID=A0A6G6XJL0_9CAUD|nr:hypothetical protein KHQ85_gp052 [Gordonia phage Skog]QIG58204.1 hypothetical protein SEA_SKOG_52 [Gordonia phage Skog]
MSIGHRLWDDNVFVRSGDRMPAPAFGLQLLFILDVENAPRREQIAAVTDWLDRHEASPGLLRSLERRGLISRLSVLEKYL